MPRVNEYEPTELEALEAAHEVVLDEIQYFNVARSEGHLNTEDEAYHIRLRDSAYWLRTRLGELRK